MSQTACHWKYDPEVGQASGPGDTCLCPVRSSMYPNNGRNRASRLLS